MSPRARQPNRTDLNQADTPKKLAVTAVPDQPYGEAGLQRAEQGAIPMGSTPTPSATPTSTPVAPGATPAAPTRSPAPNPGSLPFLQPTNRPAEPVTEGLPFGPGAGPEVLNTPAAQPRLSDEMAHAALTSGSDALINLALGLHSVGL